MKQHKNKSRVSKEKKIPKSMFGIHPKLKPFKRDENDFPDP